MSTDYPPDDGEESQRITSDIGEWAMVPAWVRKALTGPRIDGTALAVFCVLAEKADRQGDRRDFRSVKTIAEDLGVDPGTVRRALTKLREIGAVDWEQRQRPDGSKSTNDYTLRFAPTIAHPRAIHNVRAPTRDGASRTHARAYSDLIPKGSTPTVTPSEHEAAFEAFWRNYPKRNGHKVGKASTRKQWDKLKPIERDEALANLERYAVAKDGYPEDAERYLKHRRWVGLEAETADERDARMVEGALRFAEEMGMN